MNTKQNQLRIAFLGTPDFAVPALRKLVEHGYRPLVITTPDKPTGRKQELTPSPIKQTALSLELEVRTPNSLRGEFFEQFKELHPNICIVVAYGKIIPDEFLSIPEHGFINIHPSLLPNYRGPSPIQTAILNGDTETGVSLMVLDKDVDHGPVIATAPYAIEPATSYVDVAKDLASIGADLLLSSLEPYIAGTLVPREQDHENATYTKKLERDHGRIDWAQPAVAIYNQTRALNPEPGTWTTWNNKVLKITSAKPMQELIGGEQHGITRLAGAQIGVSTGSGILELISVQLEGSQEMSAQDFIKGHRDFIGSKLG